MNVCIYMAQLTHCTQLSNLLYHLITFHELGIVISPMKGESALLKKKEKLKTTEALYRETTSFGAND